MNLMSLVMNSKILIIKQLTFYCLSNVALGKTDVDVSIFFTI